MNDATPPAGHVIKPPSLAPPNFGDMDLEKLRAFAELHGLDIQPGLERDDLEREIRRRGPSHWIVLDRELNEAVSLAYENGLGVAADAICEDCMEDRVHDVATCPAAPIRALMESE